MTKFVREKDATNNSNTTIDILIQNLVVVEETVVDFQSGGKVPILQLRLKKVNGEGRESLKWESLVVCQ